MAFIFEPSPLCHLFRCNLVQESRHYCKEYVRDPQGNAWRQEISVDEHLAELQEEDVGEAQRNADADVPSDASPPLLGGERHSHYGQDEC